MSADTDGTSQGEELRVVIYCGGALRPDIKFINDSGPWTLKTQDPSLLQVPHIPLDARSNLKHLDLSNSGITSIRNEAFRDCHALVYVDFPPSLQSIGDQAFFGARSLKQVNLSMCLQLSSIARRAFCECYSLCRITFPGSLQTIGNHAFYGSCLRQIRFPVSLRRIGNGAFHYCTKLHTIKFSKEYNLRTLGRNAFKNCRSLKSVRLPHDLTSVPSGAFFGCKRLSSIELPYNLANLGVSAFEDCTALQEVELPYKLTSIRRSTFLRCKSLRSISYRHMPWSKIKTIEAESFAECELLQWIELPHSVERVYENAFRGCRALVTVEPLSDNVRFGAAAFVDCPSLMILSRPMKMPQTEWIHMTQQMNTRDCTFRRFVGRGQTDGIIRTIPDHISPTLWPCILTRWLTETGRDHLQRNVSATVSFQFIRHNARFLSGICKGTSSQTTIAVLGSSDNANPPRLALTALSENTDKDEATDDEAVALEQGNSLSIDAATPTSEVGSSRRDEHGGMPAET